MSEDFNGDDPISARLRTLRSEYGGTTVVPSARSEAASQPSGTTAEPVQGVAKKAVEGISKLTGTEKLEGFSLKAFFADVFKRHGEEAVENFFTVGTAMTTPPIAEVDTSWPRPWLFFRIMVASIVVYALFRIGMNEFHNENLIPGMMMTGVFAIPCSVLVLFVEMNVRRNVSLYQVLKVLFLGGVVSLLISLVMFRVTAAIGLNWMGASVAGIAEETGKLATVLLVVRSARYPYRLNGLLFGAAVGTGFAVFESMGYALRSGSLNGMIDSIFIRGVLSPFGHIIWTAITAAALWRVKGARPFAWAMLRDVRFLRLALVSVILHVIWNAPFELPFYGKYVILGIVGWLIVFSLIQEGLGELRAEKTR